MFPASKSTLLLTSAALCTSTIIISYICYEYYYKKHRNITISGIYIYPIKSCKGIAVKSILLTKSGLQYDRVFMLIDENNKFISQRTQPRMVLIEQTIDVDTNTILVNAPGMECLSFSLLSNGTKPLSVTVWADTVLVEDMGDTISHWFQRFLRLSNIRLVRLVDTFIHTTDPLYAPGGQTTLTDGYPITFASEESLIATNKLLEKKVTMEHFRPNITVRGVKAFTEQYWKSLLINNKIVIDVVKPCTRCKIPTINIADGKMHEENQPIRAMKKLASGSALKFNRFDWRLEVNTARIYACKFIIILLFISNYICVV